MLSFFVFLRFRKVFPKTKMTRGNQRDLAREKTQKKEAEKNKGQRQDGMSLAKAKEADAERMRLKQAAAEAKRNGGASGGGEA